MAYLHQGYVKYECIYVSGYVERDGAYVVRPARRCIGTQRLAHVRKGRVTSAYTPVVGKRLQNPLQLIAMWTRPGPPTPKRYKHENQD